MSLDDCIGIALEQQPALAALRASLAAAENAYQALLRLHPPPLIGRDLPIRRQQACLGVTIANAAVRQSEADTVYAVTRTYFGVLYARAQLQVAENVATSLRFYQERVRDLVKKGESREWTTSTVDKITLYLRLAEGRQAEANRGIERATAALREAMGLPLEMPLRVAEGRLPSPTVPVNREELVNLALARRGELLQATTAAEVIDLEVAAQGKSCLPTARTFAAAADIHATPVPQGFSNGEYRPGATSLEMPVLLAGRRSYRMDRARDFSARAAAVVNKTHNLVALDAEDAYLKWLEASRKIPVTRDAAETGARLSKNTREYFTAGQRVRIEDILNDEVLAGQAQAAYNEALYLQIIALADLQRATAGGFNPGLAGLPAPKH